MRPISAPFYSCGQCRFFLHRNCAELPMEIQHPSHKHLLTLATNYLAYCHAFLRFHHGFSYRCDREPCHFEIDIQCSLQLDTLSHPSYEHLLFLDHEYEGNCSACPNYIWDDNSAYRCTKGCKFILDFACITLPLTASEEERDPNHWFHYCADCDNTVHPKCVVGDLPFIKLGNTCECLAHSHPLTFVRNIWSCPRCNVCGKLCNGQVLECKESECNLIVHWKCHHLLKTHRNSTLDLI